MGVILCFSECSTVHILKIYWEVYPTDRCLRTTNLTSAEGHGLSLLPREQGFAVHRVGMP